MDVTSDHTPLLTNIVRDTRASVPQAKLRVSTLDQELFMDLLTENCRTLPLPTDDPSVADLDNIAQSLTQAISKALNGSAKRFISRNLSYL
jgi:hypothetical protein